MVPLDMSFSAQDWMEDVKVELGKTPVDKKNIQRMYERMHAALGDPQAPGLGSFRRRFIQVRGWQAPRDYRVMWRPGLNTCWFVDNSGFKMSIALVNFR